MIDFVFIEKDNNSAILFLNWRRTKLRILWGYDSTPEPRPFKMGTFDSNAGIGAVGSGDMSSTRNNQIWSSANSFFRNNWVWPFFACFLERWLSYGSQFFLNWPVHQNLILNLNMEQKTKHKFFMLLCKKMKNKGISKIEFWPIWPLSSAIDWVLSKYWDSIRCNISMQGTCVLTKNPTLIVKKLIFFDEIGKNHQFLTLIFPTMISGTKYSVSLTKSCF